MEVCLGLEPGAFEMCHHTTSESSIAEVGLTFKDHVGKPFGIRIFRKTPAL